MLKHEPEKTTDFLFHAAEQICAAARTAPKARGKDLLVTAVVTGKEKELLAARMREISRRDGVAFFERDAGNVEGIDLVVLIGSRIEPLGLPHCGFCGFPDCSSLLAAGGVCSFNSGDLGIAIGSAVSRAADLRLDNRIMYSAGKAALEMGMLGEDVKLAYGIPLSVSGKNPFFDRK
ncbi:MAG: DUF2148 domain-containing protein [Syntrophotaleaceae bacterium]